MKTEAAILVELGQPLELIELGIPALKPGQVLVEIAYSGVCHTQVLEARGFRGEDRFLPHCLGHEGSGKVIEVGPNVTKVAPDQEVILTWIQGQGANVPGCAYDWDGRTVNAGAVTTFQRHAVVSENRLVPIPEGVGLDYAALLGCAIPTGAGAVFNTLDARAGQALVVFGVGGVGMCALVAARTLNCTPIIAVDVVASKLEMAKTLGATHMIDASAGDPLEQIAAICPGGVDLAVEATGRPPVMRQALECVRPRGGRAVVIGNARRGEEVSFDPLQFNMGKQLFGSWGGESVPDRDYPRYGKLIAAGLLNVQPIINPGYQLEDINQALDDLESGAAVRPVVRLN